MNTAQQAVRALMTSAFLATGIGSAFAASPPAPVPPRPSSPPSAKPMTCPKPLQRGRVGLCGSGSRTRFTVGVQIRFNKTKPNKIKAR